MIRLFNYELQRKWKNVLGVLAAYFIIYTGFLLKFKSDGMFSIETFGFQLVFFIMLASALFFASMLGAVNNLRLEAKHSTRDLYFSIPMSAYTKIGSKVIISVVEVASAMLIGGYTAVKAIETLTGVTLWKPFIKELFAVEFDMLAYTLLGNFTYLVLMVLVVYLSFAIFRSFFSQVKLGGLITLIIYGILNYLLGRLFVAFFENVQETTLEGLSLWGILGGFMLFTFLIFLLVGFLFEKRVSFD